jgi:trans-aconitate methyltransferase
MSWDAVALRHKTDKSSAFHGYMDHYERVLAGREVRSVLEVGVDRGASLEVWAEVFPDAEVWGVDTNPACAALSDGRVRVVVGDAGDPRAMRSLRRRWYDLIVDDGSHKLRDIRRTLGIFASRLTPSGIYSIEDTLTDPQGDWPCALDDVLPLLAPMGLRPLLAVRSTIDFVVADRWGGWMNLLLAVRR